MGILLENGDYLLKEDNLSHLLLELGYSRGDYETPPVDDSELETAYSDADIVLVAAEDLYLVDQYATDEFAIHQFKVDATGRSSGTITWIGQTNINCLVSATHLQIFDYDLDTWTTIDSVTSDTTSFTLTAYIGSLDSYKDTNGMIACRVYQEAK